MGRSYPIRGDDASVITTATALLEGACDAAAKAVERLGLDTSSITILQADAQAIAKANAGNVGRAEWKLDAHLAPTLRVGLGLLTEKLEKVKKGQMDLGIVEPDDTDHRLAAARSLAARITDHLGSLAEAVEGLRPQPGSGITSVEITSRGRGVRLTADTTEAVGA